MTHEENSAPLDGATVQQVGGDTVQADRVSAANTRATEPSTDERWHVPTRGTRDILPTIRAGIAIVGAVAALAVWFLLAPAQLETGAVRAESHSSDVSTVRALQDANEARADSSPRQTVVNTWATVDMLEVVASQLDDLASLQAEAFAATDARTDPRIPALLFIAVLVFCLTAAAQPTTKRRRPVAATPSPEPSAP